MEENEYLNLIFKVLTTGKPKKDRTGVGTLSLFGAQLRFDLRTCFPLLTTKRMYWRGIVEELLWFIRGSTNAKELADKGIHIWDANGSKQFLENRGLGYREEGDLGPIYGWQWRHFGAEYKDMHTDYTGQGIDQLTNLIQEIKTDPDSRRLILTAWNPCDISQMALPPCHTMCQFYVCDGELSCQLYQRSGDLGLGIPFNIASYALLTRLIGCVCKLKPGELILTIGDAHIYLNHIDALKEQLRRVPRPFPTLHLACNDVATIDDIKAEDIVLEDYNPHDKIDMKMAI